MKADSMKPGDMSLSTYGLVLRTDTSLQVDHHIVRNNPQLKNSLAEKLAEALKES